MPRLATLIYIFFAGLLLQFVMQTFFTFVLWWDGGIMSAIWLWKEALIGVLLVWWARWVFFQGGHFWSCLKTFFHQRRLVIFAWWLAVGVVVTFFIHNIALQLPFSLRALAFKYDFLGFFIFFVGLLVWQLLDDATKTHVIKRYTITVMKRILLLALVWYGVVFVKPWTLKLLGYDNFVYEWTVGQAPPATYYTHLNYGTPRNQFVFERPITRWFFLIALWPLFFMQVLFKKPLRDTRAWRVIYGANVFVTFSRAARWAWVLEILLLGILLAEGSRRRALFRTAIPLLITAACIGILGGKELVVRDFSTNGHVQMVMKAIGYLSQHPFLWMWWASVWPGSHHLWGLAFNPENQFLQILVEFGILWSLGWFVCFGILTFLGIFLRYKKPTTAISSETRSLLLACSVGMIGLSIMGMVLHSFTDRMIVYPYMLLFGIIASTYIHTGEPRPWVPT